VPFEPELRDLQWVPRWTIVRRIRTQSVAEHSYYVAMYCDQIADLGEWEGDRSELLRYALWHDVSECLTGDIPGPAKRKLFGGIDKQKETQEMHKRFGTMPPINKAGDDIRAICKVANLIDELSYMKEERRLGNMGLSGRTHHVCVRLSAALDDLSKHFDPERVRWIRKTVFSPDFGQIDSKVIEA
jgi:5'-deoxynucleotidase YfbR-like HD superfamily hydrolase